MKIFNLLNFKSLKTRLVLLSLFPTLIVLSLNLNTHFSLTKMSNTINSFQKQTIPLMEYSEEMGSSLNGLLRKLVSISTGESDSLNKDDFDKAQEQFIAFKNAQAKYLKLDRSANEIKLFKTVNENWESVEAIVSSIIEKFSKLDLKNKDEKEKFLNRILPALSPLIQSFDAISSTMQEISKNRQLEINASIEQDNKASAQFKLISLLVGAIGILATFIIGFYISKNARVALEGISNSLKSESRNVQIASEKTVISSKQLSSSSMDQTSMITETAQSVSQIQKMIEINSQASNESKNISRISKDSAEKGQDMISKMILAINEIDKANNSVSDQMNVTNNQLLEITQLISNIQSKTKVIDDIVFQTKLLSFNASVEAARAGEHGKGFAVVAEEVGNLANMSGNAAKEISELLNDSINQVKNIVNESTEKVTELSNHSKATISNGSSIASACQDSFQDISKNVERVDQLINEIASASLEQAAGVDQISQSILKMEESLNQNLLMSQDATTVAEDLKVESQNLENLVLQLVILLNGNRSINT